MKHLAAAALLAATLAACTPATSAAPAPQPEPEAGPVVAVAPMSRPTRIRIPTLQVDANIIDLGLQSDGTMQVPPDARDAGWYTRSPSPGDEGPAVLAAHVNWKGADGRSLTSTSSRRGIGSTSSTTTAPWRRSSWTGRDAPEGVVPDRRDLQGHPGA